MRDQCAHNLTTLWFQLQHRPQDHAIQLQLQYIEHLIAKDELAKARRAQQWMHAIWFQGAKHFSWCFFLTLWTRIGANWILAICDKVGVLNTSIDSICDVLTNFFQRILAYMSSTSFTESSAARRWVFDQIPDLINPRIKAQMEAQVTIAEIYAVMKAMPRGRPWPGWHSCWVLSCISWPYDFAFGGDLSPRMLLWWTTNGVPQWRYCAYTQIWGLHFFAQ